MSYIIDVQGAPGDQEAFLVVDSDWQVESAAFGKHVVSWGDRLFTNGHAGRLFCFSYKRHVELRPGARGLGHLIGLVEQAAPLYQSRLAITSSPLSVELALAEMAEWAGCGSSAHDITKPLGRCYLMADILRTGKIKVR